MPEEGVKGPIRFDPSNLADHAEFYTLTGTHLDDTIEGLRKLRANGEWFSQHFEEIMNTYKGQRIFVVDQVFYASGNRNVEEFIKNLRGQGVNLTSAFSWYVPKDDDPWGIKKYWIRPPIFVSIGEAARYAAEAENKNSD